jgi:hypothetical protein
MGQQEKETTPQTTRKLIGVRLFGDWRLTPWIGVVSPFDICPLNLFLLWNCSSSSAVKSELPKFQFFQKIGRN